MADGACDADCQNLIASVPNEDLRKVERCNPDILDWCYRLHFPELRIGVQFNGSPRGGDVHVVGVEAAQLIVLAHPRPD